MENVLACQASESVCGKSRISSPDGLNPAEPESNRECHKAEFGETVKRLRKREGDKFFKSSPLSDTNLP